MGYMFSSPFDKPQTENMIRSAVKGLGGEYQNGIGKWKAGRLLTMTPCKIQFTFEETETGYMVKADFIRHGQYATQFWRKFIDKLDDIYPQGHFGLYYKPHEPVGVINLEDTSKTVYRFETTSGTSLGGFLLGGALAGTPGAIIGGMSGKKHTYGESRTVKQVAVKMVYSDGMVTDELILTPKDELYKIAMRLINK